jgi:hypothetical protein
MCCSRSLCFEDFSLKFLLIILRPWSLSYVRFNELFLGGGGDYFMVGRGELRLNSGLMGGRLF